MTAIDLSPKNIFDIFAVVALIASAYMTIRSTTVRQNMKDQAALIETQGKQIEILKSQSEESMKERQQLARQIGGLEGQIKVYKELPLRELADGMKDVVEGNKAILEVLKTSSNARTDEATDAASKVAQVKVDLRTAPAWT